MMNNSVVESRIVVCLCDTRRQERLEMFSVFVLKVVNGGGILDIEKKCYNGKWRFESEYRGLRVKYEEVRLSGMKRMVGVKNEWMNVVQLRLYGDRKKMGVVGLENNHFESRKLSVSDFGRLPSQKPYLEMRPPILPIEHEDIGNWVEKAKKNVRKVLKDCLCIEDVCYLGDDEGKRQERIFILYDWNSPLSQILSYAYMSVLDKSGTMILDFDLTKQEDIIEYIDGLSEGDLVILIQSNGFRLNEYRLRIELFKRGLKSIEHAHLEMMPIEQVPAYIDAMGFTPVKKIKSMALDIKSRIDHSKKKIVVRSKGGAECIYNAPMEPALLNIGDYKGMKNIGGTFPVGEVFSEPKNLDQVQGELMVFAYPNTDFVVCHLETCFKIRVEKGYLVWIDPSAPKSFFDVVETIRNQEGENGKIMVREFGIGLNTAIGRHAPLNNVTAFERQAGFHISLGKKHTVFKKPSISNKKSRFHIDIFIDLDSIEVDGFLIFKDGKLNY